MASDKEIKRLLSELADSTKKEFASLSKLITDQSKEIEALKILVKEKDELLMRLESDLNSLKIDQKKFKLERETRDRNYSIRIFGLDIEGDNTNVVNVLQNVYDRTIYPILELAVKNNEIKSVPPVESLLEYGHILPNKTSKTNIPGLASDKPASPSPIIIRFFSRLYRSLVFKYKKDFLNSTSPAGGTMQTRFGTRRPGDNPRVYIVEDLPIDTYQMMKKMIADDKYKKVWTINGQIRYVLEAKPESVIKIKDVYSFKL